MTLDFNEIIPIKSHTSQVIIAPNQEPYVIRMGKNPIQLQLKGYIFSTTDFDAMYAWEGTIITATYNVGEYVYKEIPTSSIWMVDDMKLQRKGGYLNQWIFDMKLKHMTSGRYK